MVKYLIAEKPGDYNIKETKDVKVLENKKVIYTKLGPIEIYEEKKIVDGISESNFFGRL